MAVYHHYTRNNFNTSVAKYLSIPYQTLVFAILIYLAFPLSAQVKFEREYRLDAVEVPQSARQFIEACAFTSKVKWYGEDSQDGKSYEAKTKHQQQWYSIEFDSLGHIQDVEIRLSLREITEASDHIQSFLKDYFDKYKIKKVQRQWVGDKDILIKLIRGEIIKEGYRQNYEIELKGKKEGSTEWYEFLFDDNGKMLRQSTIIFRNTDHLIY